LNVRWEHVPWSIQQEQIMRLRQRLEAVEHALALRP
jgi:hypothetical protein